MCARPDATAVPVDIPLTVTGVERFVVLLFPSWPLRLAPQHRKEPLARTAQVCSAPAEIEVTVERFVTVTGVDRLVVLLSPS